MCLSVYLGVNSPLNVPKNVPKGSLSMEAASWTPPTLNGYKHVYFLGQKNQEKALGCSCLLWEQVGWTDTEAPVESDETYPIGVECPFDTLKRFCEIALENSTSCAIVCDDSNGLEQICEAEDYHDLFLTPRMIERGNLIFGGREPYPYRHFTVVTETAF